MVMRVPVLAFALSLSSVAAHAQQRLIVGVTDLAVAQRELPAQAAVVRGVIGISRAIAVTGDPERLRHLPFVRYVEDDPPDAVSIDGEALEYGVNQINAEAIWGGAPDATTLLVGQGGASDDDRRPEQIVIRHARRGLLEHRPLGTEPVKLLGPPDPRQRPQARAGTARKDDGSDPGQSLVLKLHNSGTARLARVDCR